MSALVGFDRDLKPTHPWYKEKLHKKYLKESNHKLNFSGALNSQRWTFLTKGLDDFRDGYPSSSGTTSIAPTKGPAPVLHNAAGATEGKPKKRFTREQTCYSKLLPLQQARREYIAEIEYGLTQHPLALYPHLEEGVSSELFEEIVDILDPEMRLRSASGSYEAANEEEEDEFDQSIKQQSESQSMKSRDASTRQSALSEESKMKNPYTWLSRKEESAGEDKKAKMVRSMTPVLDEGIKEVTKEFCEWVTSLGGEECSIQEATIFSLFASGYDTKPALSVPIHVVELNNVPAELRMVVGATPPHTATKSSHARDFKAQSKESSYCPSWVKTKYGAWYLDPKMWKKQKVNEPLKDPKVDETGSSMDSKNRLSQKDEDLLHLHGTIAFNEFIEKKGYRKPEFLYKLYSKRGIVIPESLVPRESKSASSGDIWFRSDSASTQEDSIIN